MALALLVVAAVAVAAYLLGRSAANARGAYDRGYARGRAATAREFARGTPRYQTIYNSGFRAGHAAGLTAGRRQGERAGAEKGDKLGLQRGRRIGQLTGERQGIVSGADAALGGFADWQVGDYYIVKLAQGAQGVRFRIDVRKLMETDRRYAICANDPGDVCAKPISGR